MTTKVRLYGPSYGNSSFCRVASGMKLGLEQNHAFAGLVPVDSSYDEEKSYPGHDAEIGVFVGPPDRAPLLKTMGWHKKNFYMLPPNSTWLPKMILDSLSKNIDGFITPSTWAKEILLRYTKLPIEIWFHGVEPEFKPTKDSLERNMSSYNNGRFSVLHFASTAMQRKGTRELILAWGDLVSNDKIGIDPVLNLIMDGNSDDFGFFVRKSCTTIKARDSIRWIDRLNLSAKHAANIYRDHHLVCQPSRGEGFGLCPLEARACGILAASTLVTGHADHERPENVGVIPIETGSYEPIDDGPGATAPSLDPSKIGEAIEYAYTMWPVLAKATYEEAKSVQDDWSWQEVTNKWLDAYHQA